MIAKLTWNVVGGPPAPLGGGEARPGQMDRTWSPISETLISGEHGPGLIDALLTADQGRELADCWKATNSWRSRSVTQTPTRPPFCMFPIVPEIDRAGPGARRRTDPSPMLLRPDEPCVFEEAS